jgi:dihydrofolate reductase
MTRTETGCCYHWKNLPVELVCRSICNVEVYIRLFNKKERYHDALYDGERGRSLCTYCIVTKRPCPTILYSYITLLRVRSWRVSSTPQRHVPYHSTLQPQSHFQFFIRLYLTRAMSTPPQASHSQHPTESEVNMPKSHSLTLILAATPSLGIGQAGTLPWPQLKKEMGYFARVTKRVSTSLQASAEGKRRMNAVLMGRRTWDSIPPKFRPLKDRINIVITRNSGESLQGEENKKESGVEGPIVASGIVDALQRLENVSDVDIDRVFVIGGASVYATAMELPQTKHVLLTKINKEYQCDTFFPINLQESMLWRKTSRREVEVFTGEEIVNGEVEENGVTFEFCMFEKA